MNQLEFPSGSGQPFNDEERSQFLEAFIVGTRVALSEMAGIDVTVFSVAHTVQSQPIGDVTAAVELISKDGGRFSLSFPHRTAAALAERVLAGVQKVIDEDLVCDCVGEIANVVAGQAKALLAGTPCHFNFSLPRVVIGCAPELALRADSDCRIVTFNTEHGEFALQLEACAPGSPGR